MKGPEGKADINKDGKINVKELDQYLQNVVSRSKLSMNNKQILRVIGGSEKRDRTNKTIV